MKSTLVYMLVAFIATATLAQRPALADKAHDPRVNKAESDQMVEALKKRGVDVEYMVKDNEGHGIHNEENRFDFYEAMEKFLAKDLKPAA